MCIVSSAYVSICAKRQCASCGMSLVFVSIRIACTLTMTGNDGCQAVFFSFQIGYVVCLAEVVFFLALNAYFVNKLSGAKKLLKIKCFNN